MALIPRFDKYDPVSGGFRAPLAAAILATDKDKIQAVSINTSGQVAIGGAAETAIIGVIIAGRAMAAGEVIDVMTHGEIVGALTTAGAAFVTGAIVSVATGASTGLVASAAGKVIGRVIEADRLVIRCPVSTT
jgi:hypothetical protein